ncbi:MAG: hypothetical protein KY428_00145, partial [Bacteroidetes bacterium]|nr:hypothetical protein [Bacteroidota bacterium]
MLAQETTTDLPRFSLVDVNKGLSNNRIHCFLKDKRGYLWIGTEDGLNHYDGSQARIYQHDTRDTTSIIANTISKLFEDPAGNIWVVTPAGTSIYDPQQDKFYQHTTTFLEPYGLATFTINNIIQDNEENYWFLLRDEGLLRYNPNSKQGIHLQANPELETAISTNKLIALAQNSRGDYWLLHKNGVLEQLDGQTLSVKSRPNELHRYFSGQLLDYALFIDSDDDLWLYQPFGNRGAFLYQPTNGSFTAFTKESGTPKLNTNMVNGIVEETKGIIWLGTDHGGLNIINKNKGTIQYVLAEHEG